MLSDDDFLKDVLPLLRAKRAAQGRESDSSHDSPGQPSSPKNDPNGQTRPWIWLPTVVSQRTKFGHWENFQVNGWATPLSADLSGPVDGRITLQDTLMGCKAERVTLITVEEKSLTGIKEVRGERVKFTKDVLRLNLKGVDYSQDRFYVVDIPKRNPDHKVQTLKQEWLLREKARNEHQKKRILKEEYEALPRVTVEQLVSELKEKEAKYRRDVELGNQAFGKSRKLL